MRHLSLFPFYLGQINIQINIWIEELLLKPIRLDNNSCNILTYFFCPTFNRLIASMIPAFIYTSHSLFMFGKNKNRVGENICKDTYGNSAIFNLGMVLLHFGSPAISTLKTRKLCVTTSRWVCLFRFFGILYIFFKQPSIIGMPQKIIRSSFFNLFFYKVSPMVLHPWLSAKTQRGQALLLLSINIYLYSSGLCCPNWTPIISEQRYFQHKY